MGFCEIHQAEIGRKITEPSFTQSVLAIQKLSINRQPAKTVHFLKSPNLSILLIGFPDSKLIVQLDSARYVFLSAE